MEGKHARRIIIREVEMTYLALPCDLDTLITVAYIEALPSTSKAMSRASRSTHGTHWMPGLVGYVHTIVASCVLSDCTAFESSVLRRFPEHLVALRWS